MARKKSEPKTKEQLLLEEKEREINFIKERVKYINEPTYKFEVGEKVQYGALKESIVEEILYDGRVYVLKCIATNNNYGKPYDYEVYRVCAWHDVRPIKENDTHFAKSGEERIILRFNDSTIESLLHDYYNFGIDMNPEYQRDYVWDEQDKEYLLESIFDNIDIGKFVLIDLGEEYWARGFSYEILDGKQRLNTLIEYYENRFPYKGKYYNDLSWKDKIFFKKHNISVAIIENMNKNRILKCFVTLNKRGRVMDIEQIKKVERMIEEI